MVVEKVISVYTDGACSVNPGVGGWASVFTGDRQQSISGGSKMTTNNRMELTAVIETLRKIANDIEQGVDVASNYLIHSDSAYVVNAINKKWLNSWIVNNWQTSDRKSVKNDDLWREFVSMLRLVKMLARKDKINIELVKVKGHVGNTFNEFADSLARLEVEKILGRKY